MRAEVIAIGDELTSGQRVDTNSAWLSQQLGVLGIVTGYHTTVADDLASNVDVFRTAMRRADVVVATGGLGPTADDLTREALAAATGTDLVEHRDVLEHIRSLFQHRGREMPERNKVQALFPRGSRVIPNPHGTAPGIDLISQVDGHKCRVFALPGVPAEMKEMWDQTVRPLLLEDGAGQRVIVRRVLKCFGIGESDLEQQLPDLIRRGRQPTVGVTVHKATISLRITAEGSSEEECQGLIEPTAATIHECLGDLVFGSDDEELQDIVLRRLGDAQRSLATAECATGGILGQWLNASQEANGMYVGGVVANNVDAMAALVGLPEERISLAAEGDSLRQLVGDIAAACRSQLDADYAVAVGPTPPQTGLSLPLLHIGVASETGVQIVSHAFTGHPDILTERAAKQALDLLRLRLLNAN